MSLTQSDVTKGRFYYMEAEKSPDFEKKYEMFMTASKLYLSAAKTVTDDSLKRSLSYLSMNCAHKAAQSKTSVYPTKDEIIQSSSNAAQVMNSNRLIHCAHLESQKRFSNIPRRLAISGGHLLREILNLQLALTNIGLKKPTSKDATDPLTLPEQQLLARSTYAFNSDLGESFMVLDTKKHPNHSVATYSREQNFVPQQNWHFNNPYSQNENRNKSQNRLGQGTSSPRRPGHAINTAPVVRSRDSHNDTRHRHNMMRVEIENELNNPMVQSYLSTHSHSPVKTATAGFDLDNLTQSAVNTFNKDSIDNAEGVLNLLQTVRRIGDENAQLLLQLEDLKHLEERSASVYRDIHNFKEEFTEKFDSLKELLTEYAESVSAAGRTPSTPNPTSAAGSSSSSVQTVNTSDDSIIQTDLISSIIHKELRRACTAKEAADTQQQQQKQRDSMCSPPRPGLKCTSSSSLATSGTGGIAAELSPEQNAARNALRQQQLEKMVKALVARLEKSVAEVKKKDELLDKYLRVINKLQQQLKPNGISRNSAMDLDTACVSIDELDKSNEHTTAVGNVKVTQSGTGQQTQPFSTEPASSARLPTGSSMSAAMMAAVVAGSGSTLSTYRKPGKPPTAATTHVHSTSTAISIATPPGVGVEGSTSTGTLPPPPAPSVRSSSGTYRPHSQQPRNKHPSATTMEMLHRSTYMNSSTSSNASSHQQHK